MRPSRRIRQATAEKILAVTAADVAAGAKVDGTATWELIEALCAAGYPKTWIAEQLGRSVSNLRRHIHQPPPPRNTRWGPR